LCDHRKCYFHTQENVDTGEGGEERSDEVTMQFLAPLECLYDISMPKLHPILLPTDS